MAILEPVKSAPPVERSRPLGQLFLRARESPLVVAGGVLLAVIVLAALILPPFLADPLAVAPGRRLEPPSTEHFFGTDNYGRDVFSRTLHGTRISLFVAAATAAITAVLGTAMGLFAAYNRVADAILMRIADGIMAFPTILLAMAIMAAVGASAFNVVLAIAMVYTPYVARIVRSNALVVKEQQFIDALRGQGATAFRILWINILPNVVSALIVQVTFVFADSIVTEAALSFLGVGVPPPTPSLGNMLLEAKSAIFKAWWPTLFPGMFIAATILAVNLFGDGLRDVLDPTSKPRFKRRKRR